MPAPAKASCKWNWRSSNTCCLASPGAARKCRSSAAASGPVAQAKLNSKPTVARSIAEFAISISRLKMCAEFANNPELVVKNKMDLLPPKQRDSLRDDPQTVHVSAAKGIGLSTLLDRIDEAISEDATSRVRLRIPQKEGKALAMLEARSRIYSRQYRDGMVEMEAELPESVVRRMGEWVIP